MAVVFGGLNFYPLVLTMLFALCSGFALISSAAGLNGYLNTYSPGEKLVFNWKSSVLINDVEGNGKNVGFDLQGKVFVSTLWGSDHKRLLKLQLDSPKLKPKNKPKVTINPEENHPVFLILNDGVVEKLYFSKQENNFLKNIKKGVANLLQIQQDTKEVTEQDTSGRCNVSYTSETVKLVKKVKSSCAQNNFETFKHEDPILGVSKKFTRNTEYSISGNLLKSVKQHEKHLVNLQSKLELGSSIATEQILTYEQTLSSETSPGQSLEEVLSSFTQSVVEDTLLSSLESVETKKIEKKLFSKEVGTARENLKTGHVGSIKSAKVFLPVFIAAKSSSSDDISKALSSKKNEKILPQLYDILGYVQTTNSHLAAMKHLHLDNEAHTDLVERYLWALSFSVHPNPEILEDLLEKYRKYVNIPDGIKATLTLSVASMARNLAKTGRHDHDLLKLLKTVEETIINGFDYAKDQDRYVFLNALKNLQSPSTIPKLLSVIQSGTLKEEILAWKAVKSFGPQLWSDEILRQAEKTLLQLDRPHDTSSRTLAVDILLGAGASDATLQILLDFVASNATYEVRQYTFQSLKMLSEKCEKFNERVITIIKSSKKLNNYSALSPRGLSTALTRSVFSGSSVNGSLVSVQEIKSGIVKRGVVDVVLSKDDVSKELFTLGIFAGGLSSFVSSNDDEEDEEEESATAGMELTIIGTQIRPFVFFNGQGELMGHVWSGTASEMTPAFQALIMTQDHNEYIRLANGFIAELDFKGVVSFDLSGKIEVSIWSRTAQSLIKKSVGFISQGSVKVHTSLFKAQVDVEGSVEPQLNLEIDGDFSGNVKLCMRLSQPDSLFRLQVHKQESLPDKNYLFEVKTSKRRHIPGFTHSLNRKNNEMCSDLFTS